MMDGLRQYILSVITVSLICGILNGIFKDIAASRLMRLLCGIFMTVTVVAPIVRIDFSDFMEFGVPNSEVATAVASDGEQIAREAITDIIKSESETYVLDKAAQLSTDISVDVTVGEGEYPVPEHVLIAGAVSPNVRARLENLILTDLGITKENQIWTG
jgi:hypothetical protein